MKRSLALIFFILALISTLSVFAIAALSESGRSSENAESVLMQVEKSKDKYIYAAHGTTSIRHKGKKIISDIKIYHANQHQSRIEYLTAPLKGMIVVNDGEQSWRMDPKLGKVFCADHPNVRDHVRNISMILRNYSVERRDGGKIAGRPCILLAIKSKSGILRKRLWVDASTFVVLKSQDFNSHSDLVSFTEFDNIKYTNSLPASLFACPVGKSKIQPRRLSAKKMSVDELSHALGFHVIIPEYIPEGYKLEACRMLTLSKCGRQIAFLRYTNGLDGVSVFEARKTPDLSSGNCMWHRMEKLAGHSDHTHVVVDSDKVKAIAVVGDLPRKDLDRIIDSIK